MIANANFIHPLADTTGISQKWNKLRKRCASFKAVSGPTSLDLDTNYILSDTPSSYTILSHDDNNNHYTHLQHHLHQLGQQPQPHNHFYTEVRQDSSHEDDDEVDYVRRNKKIWETKSIDLMLASAPHVHDLKALQSSPWKKNTVCDESQNQQNPSLRRSFIDKYYADSENGNDYSEDSGWESHDRHSSAQASPSQLSNSRLRNYGGSLNGGTSDWEFSANQFDEKLNQDARLKLATTTSSNHNNTPNHNHNNNFEKLQYYDDALNNNSPPHHRHHHHSNTIHQQQSSNAAVSHVCDDKGRKRLNFSSETALSGAVNGTSKKGDKATSIPLKSFKSASMRLPGQKSSIQEMQQILRNKFNRLHNNLRKRRALSVQEVFDGDEEAKLREKGENEPSKRNSDGGLAKTTFYVPSPKNSMRGRSNVPRNCLYNRQEYEDQNNNIEYQDFNNPHYHHLDEDSNGPLSLPYINNLETEDRSKLISNSCRVKTVSNTSLNTTSKGKLAEEFAVVSTPKTSRSRFSDLSFIKNSKFMSKSGGDGSLMSKLTRSNSQKASTLSLSSDAGNSKPASSLLDNNGLQSGIGKKSKTKFIHSLFNHQNGNCQNGGHNSTKSSSLAVIKAIPPTQEMPGNKQQHHHHQSRTKTTAKSVVVAQRSNNGEEGNVGKTTDNCEKTQKVITITRRSAKQQQQRDDGGVGQKNGVEEQGAATKQRSSINDSMKSKIKLRIRPRSHSPVKNCESASTKRESSTGGFMEMFNKLVGNHLPPTSPSAPSSSRRQSSSVGSSINKKLKRLSLDSTAISTTKNGAKSSSSSSSVTPQLDTGFKKIQPPAGSLTPKPVTTITQNQQSKTEGPSSRDRKSKQVIIKHCPPCWVIRVFIFL